MVDRADGNIRRFCNCDFYYIVAFDQEYIGEDEFQTAYTHGGKVRKIIDGLIRYLKSCQAVDPCTMDSNR